MQKVLVTTLVALLTLVIVPLSFAGKVDGYHRQLTSTKVLSPTDIVINNFAYDNFYVMVPGSSVYDIVYSGGFYHIVHDFYFGNTRVVLQDAYRQTFFDGFVCRHAIIDVRGTRYDYNVNIDRRFC